MAQVAEWRPAVAVMVQVPGATAFTTPPSVTVAIFASEVFQETESVEPIGEIVALSVEEAPTFSSRVEAERVTEVAERARRKLATFMIVLFCHDRNMAIR